MGLVKNPLKSTQSNVSSMTVPWLRFDRQFLVRVVSVQRCKLSQLIIWFKMKFQLEFAALDWQFNSNYNFSSQFKIIILSWTDNPMQQTQVRISFWIKWSVGRVRGPYLQTGQNGSNMGKLKGPQMLYNVDQTLGKSYNLIDERESGSSQILCSYLTTRSGVRYGTNQGACSIYCCRIRSQILWL